MPSTVTDTGGGGNFKPIPEGVHIARCYLVCNLGLQDSGRWGPKPKHLLGFEVPAVRVEWEKDGRQHEGPAFISSRYTSSLSEKAILRQHLESWRGRKFTEEELAGFDLFKLLGVPCQISVVHNHANGNTYANINAIMGLPVNTEAPAQENKSVGYDPTEPSQFGDLPDWLQKLVREGEARIAAQTENPAPQSHSADFDDDIPF